MYGTSHRNIKGKCLFIKTTNQIIVIDINKTKKILICYADIFKEGFLKNGVAKIRISLLSDTVL